MARYGRTPAEHTQYAFAGMSLGVAPKSTDTDSPSGSHLEGGCPATGGPLPCADISAARMNSRIGLGPHGGGLWGKILARSRQNASRTSTSA